MLIINGTAQLMQDNKEFTKGTRHEFNLFSRDMPFEQQLDQIEDYFVARGWDNIEVLSNGVLTSAEEITHSVLHQAYAKAEQDGIALTINNQPIA
jgi:HD superfamily phosphohydrolase